jgi:hypothetical protein
MAGVQHNAHVIAARYARRAELVKSATHDAVAAQAKLVARELRRRIAKFHSEAVKTIGVEEVGPTEQQVIVGSDHAWYIEHGVKPGGKGLPRFFDPQSADIVGWLREKLSAGGRSPRKGSKRFQSAELELRDRYEGLAWSIRHYGVKAQPFVEPTAQEMAGPVAAALRKAVMAAVTAGDVGALQ